MPRSPRLYEPNVVYEITTRTIQGRLLMRPSREANELIAGVIGRAQHLYPDVKVYGVVALSNHFTWLASSPFPWLIPDFMGFVNGRVSCELGRPEVHNWSGKMWGRSAKPIPICDNEALITRFKYLLSQSCKEHLVRSPRHWPGVSCVPTLVEGRKLEGVWYWRDDRRRALKRGQRVTKLSMAERYIVSFEKLPCWEHLTDSEYRDKVAQLVSDIENEAKDDRKRTGRRVLGVEAILAEDPHRSVDLEESPAPLCHASSRAAYDAYANKYFAFVGAFRSAAELLKQGVHAVVFPLWSFPPRLPFVRSSA